VKRKEVSKDKARPRAGGGAARSGRPEPPPQQAAPKGPAPKAPSAASGPAATSRTPAAGAPNVRPLRDRILVRRIEETEQVRGGIIIPDTAKEKPQEAEVVAVGSGRVLEDGTRVPLSLKAGDRVLVGKWAGTEVKIEGNEYLILKEDEVLGILG
jgi:chaperonin GroES